MDVYVVHEDWANRDSFGNSTLGVYNSLDKAEFAFNNAKRIALNDGLVFDTVESDDNMTYCTYDEGYYDSAHYLLRIEKLTLNKEK